MSRFAHKSLRVLAGLFLAGGALFTVAGTTGCDTAELEALVDEVLASEGLSLSDSYDDYDSYDDSYDDSYGDESWNDDSHDDSHSSMKGVHG
jgi:hypothetical protein